MTGTEQGLFALGIAVGVAGGMLIDVLVRVLWPRRLPNFTSTPLDLDRPSVAVLTREAGEALTKGYPCGGKYQRHAYNGAPKCVRCGNVSPYVTVAAPEALRTSE